MSRRSPKLWATGLKRPDTADDRDIGSGSGPLSPASLAIVWEVGGVSSRQGQIADDQWDVFRLAFQTTGRAAVLSDRAGDEWMHDYRFLEAVR